MDSNTFMLNLPNGLKEGNMVYIKGIHKSDAKEFTIDFANDTSDSPSDITYHFNWLVPCSTIIEESRVSYQSWNRTEQQYFPFEGRSSNGLSKDLTDLCNSNDTNSTLERNFELEFVFLEDGIHVYDAGNNTISVFKSYFKYSEIKSLQISGDVENIQEVKFSFS